MVLKWYLNHSITNSYNAAEQALVKHLDLIYYFMSCGNFYFKACDKIGVYVYININIYKYILYIYIYIYIYIYTIIIIIILLFFGYIFSLTRASKVAASCIIVQYR